MKDPKTEYVTLGITKVIEDLEGLMKEENESLLTKQGVIGALQASQGRLAAELAKVGTIVKKMDAEGKLGEADKARFKGKLQGYQECIEILSGMEKTNVQDREQIKGRLNGYANLVKRSKEKIEQEKTKAERRQRAADEDPDGTRDDGAPAQLNPKPDKKKKKATKKKKSKKKGKKSAKNS